MTLVDTDYLGNEALEQASSHAGDWRIWLYGHRSDRLVLRSTNAEIEASGDSYLVFRNPRAIRLPTWFNAAQFGHSFKHAAIIKPDHPAPQVVIVRVGDQEYWVNCAEVAFYSTCRSASARSGSMGQWPLPHYLSRLRDAAGQLATLRGGTIRWAFYCPSLSQLGLLVSDLPQGSAMVVLAGTRYLEFSTPICHATFHLAGEAVTQQLRHRLHSELAEHVTSSQHLRIKVDEQAFEISASTVRIRRLAMIDDDTEWDYTGPLWEGGPPIVEL